MGNNKMVTLGVYLEGSVLNDIKRLMELSRADEACAAAGIPFPARDTTDRIAQKLGYALIASVPSYNAEDILSGNFVDNDDEAKAEKERIYEELKKQKEK